jgi:hypothetical protein
MDFWVIAWYFPALYFAYSQGYIGGSPVYCAMRSVSMVG